MYTELVGLVYMLQDKDYMNTSE